MDQLELGFAEDFGQKVDLTQRIREVLANYPEGTTILKELIQNADDAGASRVSFCLDRRRHGTDSLAFGALAEWQGPALLAFNNATFNEEDFESISRIGDSKKRGQAWKTGRFGVGFNSVYHLSDLPSFVSGRYVVMFDPHCKFLPRVSSANPGKRIDFVSTGALKMYKDQFTPYCAFGCDMESPFSGTLFRFPLRSDLQAAVSSLSRQSYSEEDMQNLLQDLFSEGVTSMLFLKSVEVIEIYEWHANMPEPQQLFSCRVQSPTAEIRWHRQAFTRLSRSPAVQSSNVGNHSDLYTLDFVSEVLIGPHQGEKRTESFLIAQSMGAAGSRIGALAKNAKDHYDIHLLPWASVAAKVASSGLKAQEGVALEGQAFCFLPLPVKTGLPVHVNGYFELSSNRRDIWYGADMDRAGKLRSDWNRCLLEDVVAQAFSALLVEASKQLGHVSLYDSLWPSGNFVEPWLTMVKRFYTIASELPLLYTDAGHGRWITPKQALYHDEEFSDAERLAGALTAEGFPLVRLSTSLRDTLFKFCLSNPRMVLPSLIRAQFCKPGKHGGLVERSNSLVVLEYCLGDVIDDEAAEVLLGLPLIPLVNGTLGVFGKRNDADVFLICTDLEYRLLESLPDKLVDQSIGKNLIERLSSIATLSHSNLSRLSGVILAQLMERLLPPDWKGMEEVEWKPGSNLRHPSEEWLKLVWQYLQQSCEDLSLFRDWPLLATTSGRLCKLQIHSKIIRSGVWSPSLESILTKVGCRILRSDLAIEHPKLSSYVHDGTAAGVVDTIFCVTSRDPQQLTQIFETLDAVERRELREYFYNAKWYAGDEMNEARLMVLRAFPIFEVYSGTDATEKINVDLVRSKLFLAPLGVHESLLSPEFLCTYSDRELEWLAGPLKVKRLERPIFYKWRVFNRLHEIAPEVRNNMMLSILKELPQLAAVDSSFREALKQLAFVPTASGTLQTPKTLYDPRSPELTALLDDQEFFPAGVFLNDEVLQMLQGLGLRVAVSPETVLQSARQVEVLSSNDADRAIKKGQELLSYLELNAVRWLPQRPLDDKSLGRMFHKVSTIFQSPDLASDETLNRFWHDLANLSWCPVLMHPPHPQLPWPLAGSSVAPPKHVALKEDMWLVSASMRILDGECSRASVLASKLGWSARQSGRRLAAQLLELGKNHVVVQDLALGQALATVVPRIYTLLNEMLGSDEVEIVKALLEGSRWVWVGDGFANVQEVAFSGPLHLAPFLRIIPADLAVFKELLLELGVRETLTPNEFALVLSNMAKDKQGASLDPQQLSAAVWLVQHLADLHFNLQEVVAFVPDANSVLVPASELVYNDAPWLQNSEGGSIAGNLTGPTNSVRGPRFVHAKISSDVAERLGVRSLRRMLLAESADSMDLGLHDAAEAFGQHEALTTRLKHIVEMYSDGPGILCELVQNADDAGAKEVNFLLDRSEFGTSSILSPRMADWQGPALYCQNDSVFTSRDLYAISRIGQDSKLERPSAIGRFGLGFNSVYHFTDIPGFISGSNLVMFDPHACNLPGVTPSHPGLKISFVGRGLLEQFPDQLRPYLMFGCDLQKPYPGTLFRFPLRTEKTAANSEIKQGAYTPEDVVDLFWSFKSSAEEAVLFLRNVASVSVYVRDSPDQDMELLYQVKRPVITMQSPVYEFVRGNPQNPIDKEQFYRKLTKTPSPQLPWQCQTVEVCLTIDGIQQSQKWLISTAMGGGRARDQAIAPENRARGFIPWAGIAAPLHVNQPKVAASKEGDETQDVQLADKIGSSESKGQFEGRAFCFLPLPVKIGLPVHVNGYFELSSNRRDIWYGDDMAGGGKLRADWNRCLLEDVAAPAYARLLVEAARELGATARFHALWPTGSVHEPWYSLLKQVYKSVVDLDLPVVYTNAAQGKWVSPKRAVFPDNSFSEAQELSDALAYAGLPIITAPNSVIAKFREVCPYLRHLTPSMLRRSIAGTRRTLEGPTANVLALKYCLTDVEEADAGEKLQGLSLVPLCDGSLATIASPKPGAGERIIVATDEESQLLKSAVPYMLVDCGIAKDVFEKLHKIAQRGGTNLTILTGPVLEELLPRLVPVEWKSKGVVTWVPGDGVYPSLEWMQLLWQFLSSCNDLSVFAEWPLLPTSDGHLIRLLQNSRVIRDEGWSENMVSVLQKAGCAILRSDMQVQHPTLGEYVHDASALGVLDSLRAAVGGHLQSLGHLLRNASDGELRELRSFLCQSKWFASGKLNASHTEVLRSLPVFESYSSSGRRFTDLPHGKRFFAPNGVSEELLGENFIRAESQKEEEVLAGYLGVTKLSRAVFYRDHLFDNMAQIPVAVTTRSMLAAIQDYSKLLEEDPTLASIMSSLPFVLTAQGTLEAPERLYDPRVPELQTLLNKDAFFPSGDFATDAVLDILVELGLKRSLGYSGLLDSARSVAMISSQNHFEAAHRAKALLAHLDDLQIVRESNGDSSEDRLVDSTAGDPLRTVEVKDDGIESGFWLQLTNISWCPVLTSAPNDKIPWQQVTSPIAAPKLVRPESQMWLVSGTMFILDGGIRSASLAAKLGWEEHPNATVLAAQLVELSKQHATWQNKLIHEAEALHEINATLNKEIPPIYKLLQEKVGTKDLTHIQEVLTGIPWVWVGEGFVFPKQLAFDSPAHFHPYLHIVPSEIVEFRKLLTTFGVRETFEAADYVRVLHRIAQDMKGGVLTQEQRTFCLRVLEALSEVIPLNGESNVILGSVVMPDDSGILALAKDLIYNDAPWLAKSASGMIGMRRFVHPDIDNELADRLGAKSLRYLSLVDQQMTSTLPCPDTSTISDLLTKKEDRNLLMFDLLEIADCCKARKVHFMYDKREHPRQSLLQPNLGSFQGQALTVAFEGAALSTEEVCMLQTNMATKLRGQFCQYGAGLLGAYHITELLFIVSSGCLYLFDPPGQVLAGSSNDGQAGGSGGMPVGKAFALKGTDLDLAQRFSDQFRPLQISSSLSWARTDATILRLPLRTEEQALNAKFKDAEECRDTDIANILDNFKSRASSALLFLKTVEDVSVTVWEEGEDTPHGLFAVRVDPARALLRNPFQEKKWRNFKYQLTSIFGGSSSASKVQTIDILLTEDGTQLVDKWLVVQCLGSGRTRDMALDRKYLQYDLTPVAGVAAHMSRNGSIPDVNAGSSVLAPLPVPVLTGLPVTIMGNFMISHGVTRHLFKSLIPPDLSTSTDRSSGSRISAESVAGAWNKELLTCVRDSYIELLQELQRLRQDPSSSRADPPIGRGLDGTYGVPAERAYSFWPRSRALTSMGSDQPGAIEGQCLAEWLIKPMYARLVEMPMWQLHGGAMAKATDGMFLLPPGAERQGMAPPATVCDFLKAHYRVFAVPYELSKEMEAAGVSAKELTPKMLRSLLKIPSVAAAVPSVVTQVDLLEFCCTDLHKEEMTTSASLETEQHGNVGTRGNTTEVQSIRATSHLRTGRQQVMSNGRLRLPGILRSEQQGPFESRPSSRTPDGQDPLEWFSDIGRALADYGAGVINDIGRDEQNAPDLASRSDESSTLDKAFVLDLKGLLCPTATNKMAKLGMTELWVGSKEQQDLLPGLASRFVHALCVERTVLADLFNDRVFQSLLKLQPFTPQVLAANLGAVLPKHWVPRGAVTAAAPWVGWTMDPANGPTADWLRMLWKNINVASIEELALFSQWPLIPTVTSTPVLVRVGQRQLVFVPPVAQMRLPTFDGVDSPADVDVDSSIRGYLELEMQHPWLLPLLRNCNVPVYDRRFLDCSIVDVCKPPPEKPLPQVVAAIFLALQQAGCLVPSDLAFTPADCDALFNLFASSTSAGTLASAYNVEELNLLRLLPIYKTRTGTYVTLDQHVHCIVPPSMFLQPDDALCLEYRERSEGGTLYEALSIPILADHEVMARFALPRFESQPEREQERILGYLLNNWSSQRQHENLVAVLGQTTFVKNLAGDSILYRPSDLMDPESNLLRRIFGDEPGKFPGGQFATAGWLVILRNVGLRSGIDPPLLLECAKKVEALGKESLHQDSEVADDFDSESASNNGVSIELWTTAGMLTEALLSNFASLYGTNFCEALGRIAFVPAERGIPSIGGSAGSRKVLAAYSEAVLVKDWPLAWTCAPILARSTVVPPEFSWGAFRLRHPPPFVIVVKHLMMVGRNGGEDILARWPNGKGMRSVEDVFGDVLKYLTSTWDGLSASDKDTLRALQIIPVANGTRLAAAGSLFARLSMDLAPFVFELPGAYLAYVDVLKSLGMKDSPTFESMRALLLQLQRTCGYQRLNPNELQAVLRILSFICDKANRVKSMTSHVLPDPAVDAVVPDDTGRLLQAKACVYPDSAGASLVGEIDSSRVRFVHPHVAEQICVQLGVRKLSEVIVEELDDNRSLEMLNNIGDFTRSSIAERLRSSPFAEAMWAVVQEASDGIPALKSALSKEKLVKSLGFAADGLWFVRQLYTRFLLLPARADVTRRHKKPAVSLMDDDDGGDMGHRVFEYVDKARSRFLIAVPPQGVTLQDLFAVALSRLIGSPVSLPVGALLTAPIGSDFRVLNVLRLGLTANSRVGKNAIANSGVLGMELVSADAVLVQCHPLRPFHAGELVAWRPDEQGGQGGLRYGRVLHDVRASAGQAMYRLEVETGPNEIRLLLSSQVLSFKGTAAATVAMAPLVSEDVEEATSSIRSALEPVGGDPSHAEAPSADVSQVQELSSRGQAAGDVSAGEVVRAVKDMLAAAGLPMGADQTSLLEHSLTLQEQLTVVDTALIEEQRRAETAVKEAEAARTAWTCRVCLTNEVDTIVIPCGHVLCQNCSTAVNRCPFCRRPVTTAQRLYRP